MSRFGIKLSEEHKLKLSIAQRKRYKEKGFSEETKRKISETKKRRYASGELIPWDKGKKRPAFSEEWRRKLSEASRRRGYSEKSVKALILRNKTNNPMWNLETRKKAAANRNYKDIALKTTATKIKNGIFLEYSKRMRNNNPMKNPEINKRVNQNPVYIKKRISSLSKKPSKKELILIKLIKDLNLDYSYVGDGKKILGTKNPDFISEKDKKIIEVFGDYWHGKKARCYEETENGRIEYFKDYGYNTLIIWEYELKDLRKVYNKILDFHNNIDNSTEKAISLNTT